MKLWSAQSISGRLTALVVFVSGIALLLAYVSYLAYDFYSLRSNLIESLDSQANLIGINSETALLFDDQQAAETTLSALRGAPSILTAEIFRADGSPFAGYARRGYAARQSIVPKLPPGPDIRILDSGWNGPSGPCSHIRRQAHRLGVHPG